MAITNQAAWLDAKGQKLRIGDAEVPELGADDVLVENLAVAINPVDYMMQDSGYFVQNWPAVLGCDLAGEVVSVGSGVTTVTKGQRVLAHPLGLATGKPANSSFQKYTVVQELAVCPIPENMTYEDAAVIPLGLSTALGGLYVDQKQPLPLPKKNPERTGKKVLIWGGSSSVGSAAIQLAVASGFDVVATSSEKNFEHCKKLGAKEVFDYGSKSIAEDLMAALPKEKLAVTFDAITARGSTETIAKILDKYGGGHIALVLPTPEGLPQSVTTKQVFAALIPSSDAGKAIYKDWLPTALSTGQFKPSPQPKVVGEGLASIQTGIDTLKNGVSATKIVVKL
ncbi:MAG: hypothetical protein MMC23_008125 [Stictis urceolatum]|nr:hypothetical protein [Stictis urceolata]